MSAEKKTPAWEGIEFAEREGNYRRYGDGVNEPGSDRLEVSGGYLYRSYCREGIAMIFVPDRKSK